jgi:hypothetical protein
VRETQYLAPVGTQPRPAEHVDGISQRADCIGDKPGIPTVGAGAHCAIGLSGEGAKLTLENGASWVHVVLNCRREAALEQFEFAYVVSVPLVQAEAGRLQLQPHQDD